LQPTDQTKPLETDHSYEFDQYRPFYPVVDWEPLIEHDYDDRGNYGDPEYKNLVQGVKKTDILPALGTLLEGVDLETLTNAQKDDLARLVAFRGVVFIRNQKNFDIQDQLNLGRHWGKLHKHATTSIPKQQGLEQVHVVFGDQNSPQKQASYSPLKQFHSDVTFEIQPPGYTSLKVITNPENGGDTIWTSQYAAYDTFSKSFQEYLEKQSAVHSAFEQANGAARAGLHVRRTPIDTVHPIVRTHPVTKWKALFVNPGFTRSIIGIPKVESDAVLQLLFQTITTVPENTLRWKWRKDDVAIWDNRSTTHSATFDYWPGTRHALRVTPHAERPVYNGGRSRQECLDEKNGILRNKDGSIPLGYND